MDMKELRKMQKSNSRTFSGLQFSTLDWGELDPFYLEHPEEIPIEHEFVGYRQDGDVAEDYQGNLYLILVIQESTDRKCMHGTVRTGRCRKTRKTGRLYRGTSGRNSGIKSEITKQGIPCQTLTRNSNRKIGVNV